MRRRGGAKRAGCVASNLRHPKKPMPRAISAAAGINDDGRGSQWLRRSCAAALAHDRRLAPFQALRHDANSIVGDRHEPDDCNTSFARKAHCEMSARFEKEDPQKPDGQEHARRRPVIASDRGPPRVCELKRPGGRTRSPAARGRGDVSRKAKNADIAAVAIAPVSAPGARRVSVRTGNPVRVGTTRDTGVGFRPKAAAVSTSRPNPKTASCKWNGACRRLVHAVKMRPSSCERDRRGALVKPTR